MYNKNSKMLLVNETFIVDDSIHDEWLQWFTNEYLKEIRESGFISGLLLSKINDNNPDGKTYAMQFKIKDSDFTKFQNEGKLIALRSRHNTKFDNKYASFVTVLDIVAD